MPTLDHTAILNPPTELKVGSEVYKLVFSHKALALAEQSTKMNLLRWFSTLEMSLSDLAAMLLASLNRYHPEISHDQCFEILDKVGVGPVFNAVVSAWKAAQPAPEKNVPAA